MDQLTEKYEKLQEYLRSLGRVAVVFSSGVDSAFLLWVAHDVLGDQVIAVTTVCLFHRRNAFQSGICGQPGPKKRAVLLANQSQSPDDHGESERLPPNF